RRANRELKWWPKGSGSRRRSRSIKKQGIYGLNRSAVDTKRLAITDRSAKDPTEIMKQFRCDGTDPLEFQSVTFRNNYGGATWSMTGCRLQTRCRSSRLRDGYNSSRCDGVKIHKRPPHGVWLLPTVQVNPTGKTQATAGQAHAVATHASSRIEAG